MAEKKSLNQKIADLDTRVDWFYGEEFELDKAAEKYEQAIKLAKDIEEDLKNLKNKISVIDKDFAND